jgi:Transposase domain (DUF772)
MMGFQGTPARPFYDFCLEEHVAVDHMLRGIDRHLALRQSLKPFYSQIGRPSIDPELMIRMLIVGYGFGIRSERRCARRSTSTLRIDGEASPRSKCSIRPQVVQSRNICRSWTTRRSAGRRPSSLRPPKICGNWRNSSPSRSRSPPCEEKRRRFASLAAPPSRTPCSP